MNLPPDLIENLLTRTSVKILASHGYSSGDRPALFAINRLTETYLKSIIHRTLSFARTNKRGKVNYDDIELSFFMESVSLGRLEDELMRLNDGPSNNIDLSVSTTKVARGFESTDRTMQNALLGADLNGKAAGIPDYLDRGMIGLPALPPLYTHKRTPIYASRTRDALLTREGATRESSLVEATLQRLIDLEEDTASQAAKDHEMTDGNDEDDRITNVMISLESASAKGKRMREKVFKEVWNDMGYGPIVSNKPVNCMQT